MKFYINYSITDGNFSHDLVQRRPLPESSPDIGYDTLHHCRIEIIRIARTRIDGDIIREHGTREIVATAQERQLRHFEPGFSPRARNIFEIVKEQPGDGEQEQVFLKK